MSTTTRRMPVPPEAVWAVLADGSAYADWVVGARKIRHVDVTWPRIDARIHHQVGVKGVNVNDQTRIVDMEEGRRLELEARLSHLGDARIVMDLKPADGGTEVEMVEHPLHGVGRFLPKVLVDPLLGARNVEALRRLERLATERAGLGEDGPGTGA